MWTQKFALILAFGFSFSSVFAEGDLQAQQRACAQATIEQQQRASLLLKRDSTKSIHEFVQNFALSDSDFQVVWCLPHSAVLDPSYTLQDLSAYVSENLLTLAIKAGNFLLVEYLVENRLVDLNQKTYRVTSNGLFGKEWSGFTALDLAKNPFISLRKATRIRIIEVLLAHGAKQGG